METHTKKVQNKKKRPYRKILTVQEPFELTTQKRIRTTNSVSPKEPYVPLCNLVDMNFKLR